MGVTDTRTLADLARFARIEQTAHDIEPWAEVLRCMAIKDAFDSWEQVAWIVKLYNAYDDIGSAFRLFARYPDPDQWYHASYADRLAATAKLPCGRERRNLRASKIAGELMVKHLDSYVGALGGGTQFRWIREAVPLGTDHGVGFDALVSYLRTSVWGTGRQAAFEWAEFIGKVLGVPVMASHGCLWESSGPRTSLERIYNGGDRAPSQRWLDLKASDCRDTLVRNGAVLEWWDVETVICDFNVMRKGRYYPGQHLAMIKAEIYDLPNRWRTELYQALNTVVPKPWCDTPRGTDKALAKAYALTGFIETPWGRA